MRDPPGMQFPTAEACIAWPTSANKRSSGVSEDSLSLSAVSCS